MLRRNIKYILIFILICILGGLMSYATNNSCDAILQYKSIGINEMFFGLIKIVVIFIAGIILFILIKNKIPQDKYNRIKLLYFAILPLLVFHNQFLAIPMHFINRSTKSSICEKSSTNGMQTQTNNINLTEYNYLKSKSLILPDIPKTADSISIKYYHDDFLGDFNLDINFQCDNNEPIDTIDKRWTVALMDKSANKKRISYNDGAN